MEGNETLKWRPARRSQELVGIGPLEAAVLRVVWDGGRVTVREVYETLRLRRRTAYTTVMTTLGNLTRKGLLRQERSERAYTYTPATTDVEVATTIMDIVVAEVLGGNARPLEEYMQQAHAGARKRGPRSSDDRAPCGRP